ncbi:MAG: glycoside hydrolase family 28 protein [Planctomycetota bacterium]
MTRLILCCASILISFLVHPAQGQETFSPDAGRAFVVTELGAQGDGIANDTKALQTAINACAKAGGGRVVVPAGKYLMGAIRLRSNVELHLAEEARLVGVDDLDAYLGFESGDWGKGRWNRALIIGEGLRNIAITGEGTIDGNQVFDPKGEAGMRGPHTVLLSDCENVTLKDVTIRDSANYAFFFYRSINFV